MAQPVHMIVWQAFCKNKYLHLLLLLIIFSLVAPFVEENPSGYFPIPFIFLVAIIFTLKALDLSPRTFLLFLMVAAAAFLLEVMRDFVNVPVLNGAVVVSSTLIFSVFLAIAIILMAYKMFSAVRVDFDTIVGGICVYFLIGYLWATFYYVIYHFDRHAFFFPKQWGKAYLFYFSFSTLTTVGYGDSYPLNKFAMVFANLEAIVGQMYLAIFVARMVGLHIIHHTRNPS